MTNNQSLQAFVPAELKKWNPWQVQYKVYDPGQGKMVIKRIRLKNIPKKERLAHAKQLVESINSKLRKGWNPILEMEALKTHAPLLEAMDRFETYYQRQVEDDIMRRDTARSYRSCMKNLKAYLQKEGVIEMYCYGFTQQVAREFLDYQYITKENSPRTRNNYRTFLYTFCAFMVQFSFAKANAIEGIKPMRVNKKKRKVIPNQGIKRLLEDSEIPDGLRLLFNLVLYCMIRRTEMTLLKVGDVNLHKGIITMRSEVSKNRKTQCVVLPEHLVPLMAAHLEKATNTDFLFSPLDYLPGKTAVAPKKLSDEWAKIRKRYGWPSEYQLYSLKDTGITALVSSGADLVQVRDQARHSDISITNKYLPHNGEHIGDGIRKFRIDV